MDYQQAYSGFSVDDLAKAKAFYGDILGLEIEETDDFLKIHFKNGAQALAYLKPDHQPAAYTMLNFEVANVEQAVRALKDKGVKFEHYEGMNTGEDDIARAEDGPAIAWFKDPAGNILSVLQTR